MHHLVEQKEKTFEFGYLHMAFIPCSFLYEFEYMPNQIDFSFQKLFPISPPHDFIFVCCFTFLIQG